MSKKYRVEKTCQNCGHIVEEKFCSNCGQENIETRKSFHYLFTHFLEDLAHYDSAFWITFKKLFFKPYELTQTYLSGQRAKFVAPVKLFIFINFIFFLTVGWFSIEHKKEPVEVNDEKIIENDSISSEDLTFGFYFLEEKYRELQKTHTNNEIQTLMLTKARSIFPKVIFIFLPFLAFTLWLFNNKKKYWYFDHGIFAFHFYSFLLLVIYVNSILGFIFFKFNEEVFSEFRTVISIFFVLFIFLKSFKKLYGKSWLKSILISIPILILNTIFIFAVIISLIIFSILSLH